MLQHGGHEDCQRIAQHDQQDIADPDTGDKTESPFVPVVQALLDDGKDDGPYRQGKNKSQRQSFQYRLHHKIEMSIRYFPFPGIFASPLVFCLLALWEIYAVPRFCLLAA